MLHLRDLIYLIFQSIQHPCLLVNLPRNLTGTAWCFLYFRHSIPSWSLIIETSSKLRRCSSNQCRYSKQEAVENLAALSVYCVFSCSISFPSTRFTARPPLYVPFISNAIFYYIRPLLSFTTPSAIFVPDSISSPTTFLSLLHIIHSGQFLVLLPAPILF